MSEIENLQARIKFDVDRLAALRAVGETVPHNDAPVVFFYKKARNGNVTRWIAINKNNALNGWALFFNQEHINAGEVQRFSLGCSWETVQSKMFGDDAILTKVEYLSVDSEMSFHAEVPT